MKILVLTLALALMPVLASASNVQTSVPFELVDNRIIVNVTVNGVSGFKMILDTGGPGVAVTPEAARRLHLTSRAAGSINGAGAGTLAAAQTRLRSVALGDASIGAQPAIVIDLGAIRRAIGFPQLDGVIGTDVFHNGYLRIDMDARQLTVSHRKIAAPSSSHRVPLRYSNGFYFVKLAVNGEHVEVLIDTGDRSSLTLFEPFARRNGYYRITPSLKNVVTGFGVGGPIRANVFRTRIDAFGFGVDGVVTRAPLGPAGVFSSNLAAGSIGDGFLKRFNTIYDGVHDTLIAWPSSNFAVHDLYVPPLLAHPTRRLSFRTPLRERS